MAVSHTPWWGPLGGWALRTLVFTGSVRLVIRRDVDAGRSTPFGPVQPEWVGRLSESRAGGSRPDERTPCPVPWDRAPVDRGRDAAVAQWQSFSLPN